MSVFNQLSTEANVKCFCSRKWKYVSQMKSRQCVAFSDVVAGAGAFFQRGAKNSDFNQKSLHLPKCLLSMNNNDIIVYN